jgi:hypothetical protein
LVRSDIIEGKQATLGAIMALGSLPPSRRKEIKDESGLRSTILSVVKNKYQNAPRSLQKRIGPSEVGTPCDRQLGYKLSGMKPARENFSDPLPSILGTAFHAWLEGAFEMDNQRLVAEGKPPRWIIEKRVNAGFGLSGSCDVFDTLTGTVGDHKLLGNTSYQKYVKEGPSETYRTQAHTYGLGFVQAGYAVNRVAILMYGKAKTLNDLHIWSEPFDMTIALKALKRMKEVQTLLDEGGTPRDLAANPGDPCFWCPFKGACEDGYCEGMGD